MIPKRRNLISLIFIVNCISKCSLISILLLLAFSTCILFKLNLNFFCSFTGFSSDMLQFAKELT